jgi:hypothetical protein
MTGRPFGKRHATRADGYPENGSIPASRSGRGGFVTAAPAILLALLPKITCSACWPAYAGLLSSMGMGAFNYGPYLPSLTAAGLVVALVGLGFRANRRRGYGPLVAGALGGMIMLIGKFGYDSEPAMYGGIVLLIGASIWNTWPKKRPSPCPACVPAGQGVTNGT